MALMKEMKAENAQLKRIYIEEKLRAQIVTEALEINGEAILPA